MSKEQRRLGRGLSSLIAPSVESASVAQVELPRITVSASTNETPLRLIDPNPLQPRRDFDAAKLQSLADSIRRNGTLQPVVLRRKGERFELVAGERRWRAAQLTGLESIPSLVRDADDETMLELALIENIQREDLNAVDRARAYL